MLYLARDGDCLWNSERPLSIIDEPGNDGVLAAIKDQLDPLVHVAKANDDLSALAEAALLKDHTSIDFIGHTRRGAIKVGNWSLKEAPTKRDHDLFKKIAEIAEQKSIKLLRFIACGSALHPKAVTGFQRLARGLSSAVVIYGTTTKIDESSFDAEHHRLRNDLRCGVMRIPKLLDLIGAFSHQFRDCVDAPIVQSAIAERARSPQPRWPVIVVSATDLAEAGAIVCNGDPGYGLPVTGRPIDAEIVFVPLLGTSPAARLFLYLDAGQVFVQLNQPTGTAFRVDNNGLRLRSDATIR